jgi:hypothetical protein
MKGAMSDLKTQRAEGQGMRLGREREMARGCRRCRVEERLRVEVGDDASTRME